jgi:hypothetical protein
VQAHHENKKHVEGYLESDFLDVAFLGESLVEEMDGRWLGRTVGDQLENIAKNFRRHFKREESGMEGVALGIAGDTVSILTIITIPPSWYKHCHCHCQITHISNVPTYKVT